MQLSEINAKITSLTGYSTSRYLNSDRLINLNIWLNKSAGIITDSQDESDYDDPEHGDFPIYIRNLVSGQADYDYPTQLLDIKRMEVALDGSNFRKAEPIDINEISSATSPQDIARNFATNKPYYDVQYGSFFLYPIPQLDVENGIQVWATRAPKPFTLDELVAGTREPGFDVDLHPILAYGASWEIAHKDGLNNRNDILLELQKYEIKMRSRYGRKQKDRIYQIKSSYINYE
jgi:hypothetical protein